MAVDGIQGVRNGQHHGLFSLHVSQLGNALGAGNGILVLAQHGHDVYRPRLLLLEPPCLTRWLLQSLSNVRPGQPQHPAAAHGGGDVIHAEQRPLLAGQMQIFLPRFPQHKVSRLKVHVHRFIGGLRQGKSTFRAVRPADVVVMEIVKGQQMPAAGAGGAVAGGVHAGVRGAARPSHPKKHPLVAPFAQQSGDHVVPVQQQPCSGGKGLGDLAKNKLTVPVALDGVPVQVGHHQHVRLHIGIDSGAGALVHLQNGGVIALAQLAGQGAAGQQRGGNAGPHVGAGPIAEHFSSVRLQNVGNGVGYSGFAVGARNGHDGRRLADAPQKVRTQLAGQRTGEIRPLVAGDFQRRNGQLGHPQRK